MIYKQLTSAKCVPNRFDIEFEHGLDDLFVLPTIYMPRGDCTVLQRSMKHRVLIMINLARFPLARIILSCIMGHNRRISLSRVQLRRNSCEIREMYLRSTHTSRQTGR